MLLLFSDQLTAQKLLSFCLNSFLAPEFFSVVSLVVIEVLIYTVVRPYYEYWIS
jgi:hypothetical protein